MRNLMLVLRNCIRRSWFLLPGVFLMVAVMAVAFLGGRHTGSAFAVDGIPVGVIDYDHSAASVDMIRFMEERLGMKLTRAGGDGAFNQLTAELLDCYISVILEIPEGMQEALLGGETPEIVMTSLADYENEAFTESYLESYLQRTALLAAAAGGSEERFEELLASAGEGGIKIEIQKAQGDLERTRDNNGISLMTGFFTFIGFGYAMYMGMLILEDKQNGTFRRMQISNVKPAAYMAGMVLGNLCVTVWVVPGVLLMLKLTAPRADIPLWVLGVLLGSWLVFSAGFQLMAAFLAKSSFVLITIGIGFVSIGNILGGAYFPLGDNVLKKLSVLAPQYYVMDTLYGLIEDPAYAFGKNIWILGLMSLLVYLLAAVVYARKES